VNNGLNSAFNLFTSVIVPTILLYPNPFVEASIIFDIRFCNAPLVVPKFCNTFGTVCESLDTEPMNGWLLHRPIPRKVTPVAVLYCTDLSLSRV
jgi:hypothetical protein